MSLLEAAGYLLFGLAAFVIERIKKTTTLAALTLPLSLPIALAAAALFMLFWQFVFLFVLLCIGLALQALVKIKFIAATISVVMAFLLSWIPLVGQIVGLTVSVFVLVLLPSLVYEAFKDIYNFFISKLRNVQAVIRKKSDHYRERLPRAVAPIVVVPEFLLSSGLSLWGIYTCVDWLDGPQRSITWPWSMLVLVPWGIVAFRAYRRDTDRSPPGGEGAELPIDLMPDGS